MPAIIEMLPVQIKEFQIELDQHPDILYKIQDNILWEEKIAAIALELNLVLNGEYHSWEITNILEELTRRMRDRRGVKVLETVNGTSLSSGNSEQRTSNMDEGIKDEKEI